MVTFGDLRSVLHGSYSARRWQDVCRLFDRALNEEAVTNLRQKWIPYALDHLHTWPNREAPRSWLELARTTQNVPPLLLATHASVGIRNEERGWRWQFSKNRSVEDALTPMTVHSAERFLACEDCKNLTYLQFNDQFLSSSLLYDGLSSFPHWRQLDWLDERLGQSTRGGKMACLRQLKGWSTHWVDDEVAGVAKRKMLTNLEHLNLVDCDLEFTPRLAETFAHDAFSKLKTLNVHENDQLDVTRLIDSLPHLPLLETLDLGGCRMTFDRLEHLARSRAAPQLKRLNLSWNDQICWSDIQQEDMYVSPELLAKFSSLEYLDLSLSKLGQEEFMALLRSPHLTSLHTLDVSLNSLDVVEPWTHGLPALRTLVSPRVYEGYEPLVHLLSGKQARQLTSLWIASNIHNSQPSLLPLTTRPELLPHLQELHVIECELSSSAIQDLLRTIDYPQLHTLDLRNNYFDAQCLETLLAQPWCASLRRLDLRYNGLNKETQARLWAAPALSECALYL